MQTSKLDFKLLYSSMSALRENASFTYKQLKLPPDATKRLADFSRENSYISSRSASEVESFVNSETAKILTSQFGRCVYEIHSMRKMIRAIDKKSGLDDARDESKSNAYRAFTKAFPSAKVNTFCDANEETSCREMYNYDDRIVEGGADVYVPVSWNKKIYQQGISVVQAGDGPRFILDSKERKIKRLNREYIRCWAVRAVKRKHKICTVENAIVMKYDAGGDVVLSIADNWGSAEKLIQRRIKETALNVLEAL